MGLLGSMIKNAVGTGISKGINKGISDGISNAVSSAAERIVAPKVDKYANSVADSFDEASKSLDEATAASKEIRANGNGASSLEQSLNRWSQSMERYAQVVEGNYATNTAGLERWNELLPEFPVWPFGGKEFSIDENYTSDEGTTYYIFNAVGATYEDMEAYVNVLKADGFVQRYKDSDSVLYKDLGGEYLVFSSVEAFNDLDVMSVGMFRTKNKEEI